ncbi:hypothetical protein [Niabella aurantiaca]|uniref:Dph6-related ATP pyrophosphatase n=1 Tax=Niabella aurantiaca TaxID=379900 RepID=UPI0003659032|nr:hypothetical protein [Niabella aurantiaca]
MEKQKAPLQKNPVVLNWSGGKDAAYSLYRLQQSGRYEIRYLLTVFNEAGRSSMHEIPEGLITAQARQTGIPLLKIYVGADSRSYEAEMLRVCMRVKQEGIRTAAFGDLFLNDLRRYREQQLQQAGMTGLFPLWGIDTGAYLRNFFESGFKAVICCVNGSMLHPEVCGHPLSPALVASFPASADPCGENGEYHSFCYAGPVFARPVPYQTAGFFNRSFPSPEDESRQVSFRHLHLSNK